ncbi:MAG: protein-(glutamine-N5) methyltransferase, release factor-specific [Rhodospirillaceae bacterium]|nr:protein-(glutamine-N5) methyltransferase, release factor-specific [Rhodospirillaceae bacterium]|tara:strand:+ start:4356 stop:5219 length:864 start_codon:yes stop_codon:yes gene_type:complete
MTAVLVGELLVASAAELADAGVDEPRRDAQLLLAHALERDRGWLQAFPETIVEPEAHQCFTTLLECRKRRLPMAQVLCHREFWSLDLKVTGETLTPRPDSETLVETALSLFREREAPRHILDLGTGTGCLLLALLSEWPSAKGVGVDRSAGTLAVARENARACDLESRVSLVEGDWLAGLTGSFDLVVSNPPYIPSGQIAGLEPEVSDHEPRQALDGGADGLSCYRIILSDVAMVLAPGGLVVLEHGERQAPALGALAAEHGFDVLEPARDLAGRLRCAVLRFVTGW